MLCECRLGVVCVTSVTSDSHLIDTSYKVTVKDWDVAVCVCVYVCVAHEAALSISKKTSFENSLNIKHFYTIKVLVLINLSL